MYVGLKQPRGDGERYVTPAAKETTGWRDFVRECFCFGSEAVNASGKAVRRLVKSRISLAASPGRNMAAPPPLARSRIPPATQARSSASASNSDNPVFTAS